MKLKLEVWRQIPEDPDLWLGEHGVLVNTAALEERSLYASIVRLPLLPASSSVPALENALSPTGQA